MKKNQPSPSKVQNLEQDPAPFPSPSLNPEAAHTTPSPQSPPPSGSSELNAPPTSEEGHIYDSPSSSPRSLHSTNSELSARQALNEQSVYDSPPSPPRSIHSDEDNSVYSSPSSPGDSSLSESIYHAPSSPPRPAPVQDSEQLAEDSTYETSPSNRPLALKRESHQFIYDVPPAPAQPHARREHVYDVPSSSLTPRSLEGELSATAEPTQTATGATIPPALPPRLKRSPVHKADPSVYTEISDDSVYATIPDLPQQGEKEQYTPLSPKKDPNSLYAALRPKSPVHSGNVEQNAASSQKRQSIVETPPALPPHPELLDVYETPDAEQKTPSETSLRSELSDVYELDDDFIYTTIPDLPQFSDRQQNVAPTPEIDPIYETIPDLPQSSDRQQNVTPTPEIDPIYETIPDLPQHGAHAQHMPPSPEKGSRYTKNIESGLPPRPGSVEQSTTKHGEDKSMYTAVGLKTPPRMKNKVPSDASKSEQKQTASSDYANTLPKRASHSKGVEKDIGLPQPPRNTRQGTEKVSQQKPTVRAFRPELPPRPGSAQQSASVSSTPSPKIPPKRFSYSKDGVPSDGSEPGLEYGHVYATVAPKTLKSSSNREQTTPESEVDGVVFAFPRTSSDLSQSRNSLLTREVQEKVVCEARKSEVQRCCRVVYGKDDLLNSQMKKVEKNPDLAEEVSMQLSSRPDSLHKLAGTNLCGLKNGRRKEAEAGIFDLVKAVEAYGSAVKSLKEIQALSKMEVKPLSDYDVRCKVRRMPTVQEARQEVRLLCKEVFGDTNRLDYRMEELEKAPNMAEELAWQLENHTGSFGKLAGHKFCGVKTNARKTAEHLLPDLCKAINNYSDCVTQARESVLENHKEKLNSHKLFMEDIRQLKGPQKENADLSKKTARVVSESSHHRSESQKQAGALSL
ncbi:BID domain-containing T4SS effector [Bartonella taylorii]|uniref:BID domain-containing T4SS effector n=1 Tax=Bartonella taylorii TaxID=33046 RepID=UPI001ABB403D|nr:BID domain-containing T4SS effector [Bartonella taylorii]